MYDPDEELLSMMMQTTLRELQSYMASGLKAALADLVVGGDLKYKEPLYYRIITEKYDVLDKALDAADIKHEVLEIEKGPDGKPLPNGYTRMCIEKADLERFDAVVNELLAKEELTAAQLPQETEAPLLTQNFEKFKQMTEQAGCKFDFTVDDNGLVTMQLQGQPDNIANLLGVEQANIIARFNAVQQAALESAVAAAKELPVSIDDATNETIELIGNSEAFVAAIKQHELPFAELESVADKAVFAFTPQGAVAARKIAEQLIRDNVLDISQVSGLFAATEMAPVVVEVPHDLVAILDNAAKQAGFTPPTPQSVPTKTQDWTGDSLAQLTDASMDTTDISTVVNYEVPASSWDAFAEALEGMEQDEALTEGVRVELTRIRQNGHTVMNLQRKKEPIQERIVSAKGAEKAAAAKAADKVRNRSFIHER